MTEHPRAIRRDPEGSRADERPSRPRKGSENGPAANGADAHPTDGYPVEGHQGDDLQDDVGSPPGPAAGPKAEPKGSGAKENGAKGDGAKGNGAAAAAPWHRDYPTRAVSSDKPLLDKARSFAATEYVKQLGIYSYYRPLESAQAPEIQYGGRTLVMMGSNNYLGLVNDRRCIEAAKAMADKYGTGCAGSRLLNGSLDIHEQLEERLAAYVGKEASMVYSTGFQANIGCLSALLTRNDTVIVDKCDHASIVDGVLLSRAKVLRFRHNDVAHLERMFERVEPEGGTMLVVDGVFSMEGDIAPLPEMVELCKRHKAVFMVDDAHGLGVLGEKGRGTAMHFGVVDDVDIIMGTFSKSLASIGGFIAADHDVIDFLKHTARAMIFSASMPPPSVGAVLCALDIIEQEPERIDRLWANARFVRETLQAEGFDTGTSCTPIIPIMLGDDQLAYVMCAKLFEAGVFVNPVPGLSMEARRSLLRVSVMATHERSHLERALEAIVRIGRELGVLASA